MEKHAKLCFCRRWEQLRLKGRAKHPFKVHIWASISKRGVTRVLIFSGNMDSTFYVGDILEKTLLPFIQSHFPDGHCFQQDNDLKHTNRLAQEFMACHGIKLWKLPPPPESPDLNPIELIWHELEHFLCTIVKPTTKDELLGGISRFWQERMKAEKCTTYINHLQKVLPLVVQREGRVSGH